MNNKVINTVLIVMVAGMLLFLAFFVKTGITADAVAVLSTEAMACDGCVTALTEALHVKKGIASIEADRHEGSLVVGYNSAMIGVDTIALTVNGLGYRCKVANVLTREQFRTKTGRDPGCKVKTPVCGSACCNKN